MNKIATLHAVIALFGFTISDLPALTEEEYRARYPFSGDHDPGDFKDHPAGRYRVFTQFGVRECDIEGGNVRVLTFYDGKTLIRSYSLKQLFPDQKTWHFHPASGVFLWLMFNPKLNGFHGENYTAVTVSGIQTFAVATGEPIEPPAEQVGAGQPVKRSELIDIPDQNP
jgi:hypothetical protein